MPSNHTIPAGKPNAGKVVTVPADTDSADVPQAFKDFADSLPAGGSGTPATTAADAGKVLTVNTAGNGTGWSDGTLTFSSTGEVPTENALTTFVETFMVAERFSEAMKSYTRAGMALLSPQFQALFNSLAGWTTADQMAYKASSIPGMATTQATKPFGFWDWTFRGVPIVLDPIHGSNPETWIWGLSLEAAGWRPFLNTLAQGGSVKVSTIIVGGGMKLDLTTKTISTTVAPAIADLYNKVASLGARVNTLESKP